MCLMSCWNRNSSRAILDGLHQYIDAGNAVPEKLSMLEVEWIKRTDIEYYPKAWGKTGTILLKSIASGSYVITFGDQTMSILSYWRRAEPGPDVENDRLSIRGVAGEFFPITFFICMVVLFVGSVVADFVLKRKSRV